MCTYCYKYQSEPQEKNWMFSAILTKGWYWPWFDFPNYKIHASRTKWKNKCARIKKMIKKKVYRKYWLCSCFLWNYFRKLNKWTKQVAYTDGGRVRIGAGADSRHSGMMAAEKTEAAKQWSLRMLHHSTTESLAVRFKYWDRRGQM